MPIKPKPYEPPREGAGGPTAVEEAVAEALRDNPDAAEGLGRMIAGVWKVVGASTAPYWPY